VKLTDKQLAKWLTEASRASPYCALSKRVLALGHEVERLRALLEKHSPGKVECKVCRDTGLLGVSDEFGRPLSIRCQECQAAPL